MRRFSTVVKILILIPFLTFWAQNKSVNVDSLKLLLESHNIPKKISAYYELIEYYQNNDVLKAISYGEEAAEFANEKKLEKDYAEFIFQLGISKHKQSKYFDAIKVFENAEKSFLKIGDSLGVGKCFSRIGRLHIHLGEFETALELCLNAIRVLEKQGDIKALADAYNYHGIIYYILKEYDRAESLSKKALEFSKTVDDDLILAQSYEHLCIVMIQKKEFVRAEEYAKQTLQLRLKNNDISGQAGALSNLAIISRMTGKNEQAIKYYEQALKMQEAIDHQGGIASSLTGISRTYYKMSNYSESLKYVKKSYKIRSEQKHRRGVVQNLSLLADIYTKLDDHKKALEYYKLSKVHNDSLVNEKKNEKIALLQERFEHENQINEIKLLQKENTLQKQTQIYLIIFVTILFGAIIYIYFAYRTKYKLNKDLIISNEQISKQKAELEEKNNQLHELIATKDKFFSIIAHDLKSPFQGLLGLLQVLNNDIKEMDHKDIEESVSLVKNSADNMYDLLENLLEWANVQRGNLVFNKNPLNIFSLADEIVINIKPVADNKEITLVNNIDKEVIVNADFEMISAVLRNLVSNAIKFSWKKSTIILNSKVIDDSVQICVADNGIGMNEDMIDSLFEIDENTSRLGTEGEKSTGLGLILCKEYIDRHNGKIWVESKVDKGSEVCFSLPSVKN